MAEVNLPDRSIYEPTTSELHPPVTMPQGTQHRGVEFGHEHRDINVRSIMVWFAVLGLVVALTYALLYGMFKLLDYFEARKDVAASAVLAEQVLPPPPRLLPNPVDSVNHPNSPMLGPGEWMVIERSREYRALNEIGLWDPGANQGRIPNSVLERVAREGSQGVPPPIWGVPTEEAANAGMMSPLPSDSSGGRRLENGLR